MDDKLRFSGLVVAPDVVTTIVKLAAEKVEGVSEVGVSADLNNMVSLIAPRRTAAPEPITVDVLDDDSLAIAVHLTVEFDHPFVTLADEVRAAVAESLQTQFAVQVARVDVFVDALVFPK